MGRHGGKTQLSEAHNEIEHSVNFKIRTMFTYSSLCYNINEP